LINSIGFIKERHELLEKSGISVSGSGIALEKDRLYLVNLNPDPALNELLVYYLKVNNRCRII
jgi:kinesin family protein 13